MTRARQYVCVTLLAAAAVAGCRPGNGTRNSAEAGADQLVPADRIRGHVVPFESPRNQVMLAVRLGEDGPFNFLLDTGVTPSVVDLAVARTAGLDVDTDAAGEAVGTGSEQVVIYPTAIEGISIAGRPYDDVEAVALDLSSFTERLGRPLHGILGYSFLSTRAVRYDYGAGTLEIFDAGAPDYGPETARRARFPMVLDGTDIHISPVYLNGSPITAILDTGSSLTLELSSHAARRIGLDRLIATADTASVRGARGEARILTAHVDSIRIGALPVPETEIHFPERDREADANLGNAILRHFVLTVDYVNRVVWLEAP